ncbi:epoxide hydrolase family protein [Phytomonospora sp. NPDC050363]|uniref:epoxide hydrolase family protein n=1 Tax=Phytomonospora sp. NPDC050363 TaxID=3155642 RepID=UPI0033CF3ACA
MREFRIEIPQADLDDLHARLDATRWPADIAGGEGWDHGVPLAYLKDFAAHWRAMDWRAMEDRLNAFPQFVTIIDDHEVHFLHVRSADPDAVPLILTHGWPNSFVEFADEIEHLTPRFHVVIPSLPGFGFSEAPKEAGFDAERVARMWAELMERLGYDRYIAQGGDFGAYVAPALASAAPDHVIGVHIDGGIGLPTADDVDGMEPAELAEWEQMQVWTTMPLNHHAILGKAPRTFAYGHNDSPAGLLAWLLHKFKEFTISAETPDKVIDRDLLLANAALYWFTGGTATTSWTFDYVRAGEAMAWPAGQRHAPTGVYGGGSDFVRRRAERDNDIAHWPQDNAFSGHFVAMEQPAAHAADIAAFAAKL